MAKKTDRARLRDVGGVQIVFCRHLAEEFASAGEFAIAAPISVGR